MVYGRHLEFCFTCIIACHWPSVVINMYVRNAILHHKGKKTKSDNKKEVINGIEKKMRDIASINT